MTLQKQLGILCLCCILGGNLHAQIEGAHIFSKGQSATGLGVFIHGAGPINKADEVGGEVGVYYFAPPSLGYHMASFPLLVTFQHTFNGNGTGWYIQPGAGYSFGETDIPVFDANGIQLYNSDGTPKDQKISGPTAALGFGYLIPSVKCPLNIGLRYEHIFVSGFPSQNMIGLRVSWSLSLARRLK
ncbi:MAG TPA: hypothetical protein VNU72_03935 [Puia sp.]|nr:hypothetical protein [Puia sp.]